jgi:hypothetical protein
VDNLLWVAYASLDLGASGCPAQVGRSAVERQKGERITGLPARRMCGDADMNSQVNRFISIDVEWILPLEAYALR